MRILIGINLQKSGAVVRRIISKITTKRFCRSCPTRCRRGVQANIALSNDFFILIYLHTTFQTLIQISVLVLIPSLKLQTHLVPLHTPHVIPGEFNDTSQKSSGDEEQGLQEILNFLLRPHVSPPNRGSCSPKNEQSNFWNWIDVSVEDVTMRIAEAVLIWYDYERGRRNFGVAAEIRRMLLVRTRMVWKGWQAWRGELEVVPSRRRPESGEHGIYISEPALINLLQPRYKRGLNDNVIWTVTRRRDLQTAVQRSSCKEFVCGWEFDMICRWKFREARQDVSKKQLWLEVELKFELFLHCTANKSGPFLLYPLEDTWIA